MRLQLCIRRRSPLECRLVPLVDYNNDGVISLEELKMALAKAGVSFSLIKSWFAMVSVDRNGNGVIDGQEIQALADYAHRHWNIDLMPVATA